MVELEFSLANEHDDVELRNILSRNIMEGTIGVTCRREPSYFNVSHIQGEEVQIIKVVDRETGNIVCFGGRFMLPAHVNGEKIIIGYLADLRVEPEYRNGTLLPRAFKYVKQLHEQKPVPFYTTMILDGNELALKALTTGRTGIPTYHPYGKILTPAIHLDFSKKDIQLPGISITKGCKGKEQEVFKFINRTHTKKQFAPYHSHRDLNTKRLLGLSADGFYIATKSDDIVGVIAAWDQEPCRQMHVERYSRPLRIVKPLYNIISNITPIRKLPNEGEMIPYFYAALIAIENNDLDVFRALLRAMYQDRYNGKWHYFVCGLHESDPLAEALEEYRKIDAAGHLFCVYFPEFGNPLENLDNRIPYVEIAEI